MDLRRLVGLCCLVLLAACASKDGPRPVPGSTYWIGQPTQGKDTELFLKIFTNPTECAAAFDNDTVPECEPQVDRATGEVRLSFQTLDKSTMTPYPLPLEQDQVQVAQNKRPIKEGARSGYQLGQHGERRWGQLFILLIDGSGSMYDNHNEQITKVYRALLNPSVMDSFFPKDVQTGVILLRFTSTVKGLDGGAPVVIENKRQYQQMVKSYLMSNERGFTHLYDAIDYAINPLMEEKNVKDWLAIHKAEPTIVALTDGFNNEAGGDVCSDNAPRLQRLLEDVEVARSQPLGLRPTIFTVGIGRPINPGFDEVPRGRVSPRALCGRFQNEIINGYLERMGIDNVSLKWIAKRGGGTSFAKRNPKGLAEVFEKAAAVRYSWYTVHYKVDPFYHRQKFETRIRLTAFANAEASVDIYPSGWLDAPTGQRGDGQRWAAESSMRQTFALGMPLLGGLVLIAFFGPASFNARRAVFRRKHGSAPGTAPPPSAPSSEQS